MIQGFLLALSRASIAWPRLTLLGVGTLTLLGAVGIGRVELRTDGHALVPPDHPTTHFDADVRRVFDLHDPIVVHIETTHLDGIYNPDSLRLVQALSDRFSMLESIGPERVMSLATESSPRVYPGTLDFRPFLDPPPDTPKRIAGVRRDVATVGLLTGNLVSEDERATTILLGTPRPGEGVDRAVLYREILAVTREFESDTDRILVVGAPVAEALLGWHILEDLGVLVPLSMTIIAGVIWIGCRRFWGVVLALGEVGACLLFTFGVMGWTGAPVYLTTAMLPVILTTIGLADEIHILWHYQRLLGAESPHSGEDPLLTTMEELVRPITFTSITTAVAFLSFLTAPIVPVKSFGIYAALGIGFCWLFSLTAMPAALALLGPEALRRRVARRQPVRKTATRLVPRLLARPGWTVLALLLATVAVGAGVRELRVQDSWVDGFAASSPFRLATERVDESLYGTHVLFLQVTIDPDVDRGDGGKLGSTFHSMDRNVLGRPASRNAEGPLLDPLVLEQLGEFEAFLRQQEPVKGLLGPHRNLMAMKYMTAATGKKFQLPDTRRGVADLIDYYDLGPGVHRRREFIHDDLTRTVVTLLLQKADYRRTDVMMEAIGVYEARHLAPLGIRIDFAGDIALSQIMIPAIVRTQLGSIIVALLGVFLTALLLMRSLRMALWTVLPTAVAVLWMLGAMGWLDIPMGVATSTFCAITLGIGVDFAIHLLDRIRRGGAVGNRERITRALQEAAPAICANAIAVTLGFGALAFSQVPSNARLGLLVAVALMAAAAITLLGLSALLVTARPSTATPD